MRRPSARLSNQSVRRGRQPWRAQGVENKELQTNAAECRGVQTNAAECRGVRAVALWRADRLVGAKSAFRILRHNCVTTGCSRPRRSGSHLGVRAARGCADSSPRICGMLMPASSCWLRATLSRRACSYAVRVGWSGSGSSSRDCDARPFPFFDAAPLACEALRLPIEARLACSNENGLLRLAVEGHLNKVNKVKQNLTKLNKIKQN